jgi:hypothetical protein
VPNVNRLLRHTHRLLLPLLIAVTGLSYAATATAGTANETGIEGIWSFNGGQIGVEQLSDGSYAGTVVAETTFAECTHPVGQQIWTSIKERSDGSFEGLHQWYEADCKVNPELGPTAWRVFKQADGSRYMRVCFSHPGTTQPTIPANGEPEGVTYGCYNSALIAPLPVVGTESGGGSGGSGSGSGGSNGGGGGGGATGATVETLSLPNVHVCLSAKLKKLKIRMKDPQYDPFKTVVVVFKGHRLSTSRHGAYVVATINLSHLRARSFTIKVKATTVLGHTLTARRTYHLCTAKHRRGKHGKKG